MRSDGEKLFVAKAGADHADPLVRYVVDDEFGNLAHKDKSFADYVMFWRNGDAATRAARANSAIPTSRSRSTRPSKKSAWPSSPAARTVVIERRSEKGSKLPGL